MKRSNLMRTGTLTFLMFLGASLATSAAAQLKVWEDYEVSDAVWSLTMIKLDPGTQNIYLEGLTNEINDQQTLSASEPASGKARERRHSRSISSERNAAGGRL